MPRHSPLRPGALPGRLAVVAALLATLLAAACSSGTDGKRLEGLYIALGDSLSEGSGASNAEKTAFVALVHAGLGPGVELLNLGIAGNTSEDLISSGPLDRAIAKILEREQDGVAGNEVTIVTLEIGGNDLLSLFFELVITGVCPSVERGLQKPQCVDELSAVMHEYEANLETALDRLDETGADFDLFLMTLYNPFSGKARLIDELIELSLEGMGGTPFEKGLHDIVRDQAEAHGAHLVDIYPLFDGKGFDYIASDSIHPNDEGYRAIADALLSAIDGAGFALPAN